MAQIHGLVSFSMVYCCGAPNSFIVPTPPCHPTCGWFVVRSMLFPRQLPYIGHMDAPGSDIPAFFP